MSDALGRHGKRLEPLLRDVVAGATDDALSVDVAIEPVESSVDLVDLLSGLGRERKVAVSLDGKGVALSRFLVELNVAWLTVSHQRRSLSCECLGVVCVSLTLVDEFFASGSEPLRVGQELGLVLLCSH